MTLPEDPPTPEPDEPDEVARLRAENEKLRHEVERLATGVGEPSHHRLRAVAVGVLVALAAVSFTGATVGVWARRSLLNDEVFAARVVPLAEDAAVQAAVAAKITDELMTLVDPQALFREALPDRAQVLATPLTSALRSFVADQVAAFLASDTFQRLWRQVVTRAHDALVKLLNGDAELVSTSGNTITINLVPVINQVLARIGELSPQIFGRTIDLPTLTAQDVADAVPDVARQKLSEVLDRPIPEQFGVIEIQGGGDALSAAQDGVRVFNLLVWVLVALSVVLIPLALWLSRRRRRTLLQLTAALAVGVVLVRRGVMTLESETLAQVRVSANRPAVQVALDRFTDPLLSATTWILAILLLIAVVAIVTGPYAWAARVRDIGGRLFAGGASALGSVAARAGDESTIAWVRGHRGTLQAAGVAVAVLALLVFDLSWFGLLVLLALLGGYLAAVWWVTGGADIGEGGIGEGAGPPPARPDALTTT